MMEKEPKKVPFQWALGNETVSLQVARYACKDRLYIGMTCYREDGPVPFADMTVNLPAYDLKTNEAFISGDISRDLIRFIRANQLGTILPYQVRSGYGEYAVAAFNLDRLSEFDPKGVEEFRKIHHLPEKKTQKKQNRSMER